LSLDKLPIGLEFIEKDVIDILEKYTGKTMPYHEYPSYLMLIMEGDTQDEILAYFSKVGEICKKHGCVETYVAGSERARRFLIESREKFYPALKKFAPIEEIDVVVPRSEIARFVAKVKEISLKFNIPVIAYGHAGDGNVHLHPLCTGISSVEWQEKLPYLTKEIYLSGINFGGAISGEHGIGIAKKNLLPDQLGNEQMELLKGIKNTFDPKNILNPGKIFD
jgi:glycolate oxidase